MPEREVPDEDAEGGEDGPEGELKDVSDHTDHKFERYFVRQCTHLLAHRPARANQIVR